MPAPNLKPRVPGEALPSTDATPDTTTTAGDATGNDQLRAELEAIASLNVPEVLESLATLNRDELVLLHAIETEGKGRVTVLGPISDQLDVLAQGENETNTATAGGTAAGAGQLSDAPAPANTAPNLVRHGSSKGPVDQGAPAKSRRASDGPVTKAEQPAAVLTADGWVVPEPEPKE